MNTLKRSKVGLSGSEAADQVLHRRGLALENRQIACGVYFSLAETSVEVWPANRRRQVRCTWRCSVGWGCSIWAEEAPADLPARRAVLQRLEAELRSPQPQVRPVKLKPEAGKVVRTDLPTGTCFAAGLAKWAPCCARHCGFQDLGGSLDYLFQCPVGVATAAICLPCRSLPAWGR